MKRAIVLLSGGLDSATTLYFAKDKGYDCHCLIFDYGQRHNREIESAKCVAQTAGCKYEIIKIALPWKGSSLLDKHADVFSNPEPRIPNLETIPNTYVPARNIIFLSFALSCAEATGAEAIFIGANAIDFSGYPDCRPEFYRAYENVIRAGTKAGVMDKKIRIITPLIDMSKADIIKLGVDLKVPYELTWSCYYGGDRPCGECDSCKFRQKGFTEAGINDPALIGTPQSIAKIHPALAKIGIDPSKGWVHEIFTSIQGEGIFAGKRQIFVRFFGCNLNCAFCDTAMLAADTKEYSADDLFNEIRRNVTPQGVHSVSLTGGEPLLHAHFLKLLLPKLKQGAYRVYLETNGTLPGELAKVIDFVDIVAMDIKLSSSTLCASCWDEHSRFLKIAMKKQVFVKIIITDKTTSEDLRKAALMVSDKDPHIAFVLQPVSPVNGVTAVKPEILENFRTIASEYLYNVKIVPQMHKMYRIR